MSGAAVVARPRLTKNVRGLIICGEEISHPGYQIPGAHLRYSHETKDLHVCRVLLWEVSDGFENAIQSIVGP